MQPGCAVEHRPHADQHGGAAGQVVRPWRELLAGGGGAVVGEEARGGREAGARPVETGWGEAQVQMAEWHLAAGVGRQAGLVAQRGQWPGEFAAAVERGIGCGGDRGMGQAEGFGSGAAGELQRFPDDDVR